MGSADKRVAHFEESLLNEDGSGGASAGFDLRFDDTSAGVACWISRKFENFSLKSDHFQKFFDTGSFGSGNFADHGLSAPLFGGEA